MDQLWAPWRIRYILGKKSTGCIFCDKASQRDEEGNPATDEANLVVLRGKSCYALLNTFPYNGGHLMVAPYQHTSELSDLSADVLGEIMAMTVRCQDLLRKTMRPDGFNVGLNQGKVAGAGILDHLHFHIVPRWEGDTNFMPVLAETRVLPEALSEVCMRLRKEADQSNG